MIEEQDSPINQDIKRKLVSNEVIMNASQLVNDLSEKLMFNSCDIYECADNMFREDATEEEQENGDDMNEPLEWWFVSEYFFTKLKEKSEVVFDSDYGYLWGRTVSGQAILLDSVISHIAEDMEILEGQNNSWKGKL